MKRQPAFFLLALAILPLLVYLPALTHELIWDSRPIIMENDLLKGHFSPAAPFRSGYWATTSQRSDGGYDYYRPLTILSFMAEKAAWGLSPFRLRLVNLMIFITALFCLYFFLSRQAAPRGAAETAVALYALFPLHLDNINWVVGRCDLLMLLFGVLSLLLFDHFLEKKLPWLGLLALASFALALLAKEASLFFLPLFPLHELFRRRRLTLPLYVPPLLVTAGFWLLKSMVISRGSFPIRLFPAPWENILSPLGALGYYARSLAFPFQYDMFLPVDAVQTFFYLAAGLVLALLVVLVPVFGRKQAELIHAWLWIAPFLGGTLLMVFTPIYPFSISTRYLLVPAIGWTWLLGHWLAALRPTWQKTAIAALLLLSATAVIVHSQKYRSESAFWEKAVHSCPNDSFFLSKYAGQLREEGDFIRSEVLLRRALSFKMKNSTAVSIALQLADVAFAKALYEESLGWLEKIRPLHLDLLFRDHLLRRALKIGLARGDLAAAEATLREMARALPADRMTMSRLELYLAFAEWGKARLAASALPASQAQKWLQAIQKEERSFRSLEAGQQARFFINRGNFGSAWESWPGKEVPGIPEQLQAAKLAILAGRTEEGEERIQRLAKTTGADFRVLNGAGNLFFDLQRAGEALDFYRRSLRRNPAQPALVERVNRIVRLQRHPFAPRMDGSR